MTATNGKDRPASPSRLVWDLPVRLFHWGLVLAVLGAFITHRLGVKYFDYHLVCGYAVIVLVVFRIAWGFVGTRHALFTDFVRGPRKTFGHLRAMLRGEDSSPPGHNPVGGAMVVALLGALAAQAGLGLFSNDEIFNAGPFAALISPRLSQDLSSMHRKLFYGIAIAITAHVAAVLWHQWGKREDLLRPMITGRKRLEEDHEGGISSSRLGFAIALILLVTGVLAFAIGHAPAVSGEF